MTLILPTDPVSIFEALNSLTLRGAQLAIVRPDNPPPGIAGFIFDVTGDEGVELESDITDHFVEDNTAIQDQIALRPEVVTVNGSVAELIYALPKGSQVATGFNPLPLIDGLLPKLLPNALQAQVLRVETAAKDILAIIHTRSLYGFYSSKLAQQPNETKQSKAFGYFYQLWKGRQLSTVETPWGFFTNMAIQSLASKQPADTRSITDFSITFKKIHTAKSIVVSPGLLAGRLVFQASAVTQNGVIGQLPVSTNQASQYISRMTP